MAEKKRRSRKDKDNHWLPVRVYRGKCAYEWHPEGGGAVRLCGLDAKQSEVLKSYEDIVEEYKKQTPYTLSNLANEYFKSIEFIELSPTTQKDYDGAWLKVKKVFGKLKPDSLTSVMIRTYMDIRALVSKHRANRERVLLHNFYIWGFQRGKTTITDPTKSVTPFKLKSRERYIEDHEYNIVYQLSPPVVQACMEIALICATRQRDILDLQVSHKREDGLYIRQGKTGKKQIKRWTPRLLAAIASLEDMPCDITTMNIVHTRKGTQYTSSGFKAMWQRSMDKAMGICRRKKNETDEEYEKRKTVFLEKYPPSLKERYTFHDIKAKSISDYEQGNKQEFAGHKSARMTHETYDRKPTVVNSHNPKSES